MAARLNAIFCGCNHICGMSCTQNWKLLMEEDSGIIFCEYAHTIWSSWLILHFCGIPRLSSIDIMKVINATDLVSRWCILNERKMGFSCIMLYSIISEIISLNSLSEPVWKEDLMNSGASFHQQIHLTRHLLILTSILNWQIVAFWWMVKYKLLTINIQLTMHLNWWFPTMWSFLCKSKCGTEAWMFNKSLKWTEKVRWKVASRITLTITEDEKVSEICNWNEAQIPSIYVVGLVTYVRL